MPWTRVRQKMLDAKRDAEWSAANWNKISYDSNPPLLEDEVKAVESEIGTRLPDEYRGFLLTIGNGGVGPGYGLYPLLDGLKERGSGIYGLDEPFVPPRSCSDWVDLRAPGMHLLTHEGCAFYSGIVVAGPLAGTVWTFVEVAPGWVPIVRSGYAGKNGRAFAVDPSDPGYYTEMYDALLLPDNAHLRMSFLEWYEIWLDRVLASAS